MPTRTLTESEYKQLADYLVPVWVEDDALPPGAETQRDALARIWPHGGMGARPADYEIDFGDASYRFLPYGQIYVVVSSTYRGNNDICVIRKDTVKEVFTGGPAGHAIASEPSFGSRYGVCVVEGDKIVGCCYGPVPTVEEVLKVGGGPGTVIAELNAAKGTDKILYRWSNRRGGWRKVESDGD